MTARRIFWIVFGLWLIAGASFATVIVVLDGNRLAVVAAAGVCVAAVVLGAVAGKLLEATFRVATRQKQEEFIEAVYRAAVLDEDDA